MKLKTKFIKYVEDPEWMAYHGEPAAVGQYFNFIVMCDRTGKHITNAPLVGQKTLTLEFGHVMELEDVAVDVLIENCKFLIEVDKDGNPVTS